MDESSQHGEGRIRRSFASRMQLMHSSQSSVLPSPPQRDFGGRSQSSPTTYAEQLSPVTRTSDVGRTSARWDTVEHFSEWSGIQPSSPPSDTPPPRRSQHVIIPSFEHSGMAQSSAQHTYISPFERSHVPSWKESQYSAEFRHQELNDKVARADFVPVWRGPLEKDSTSSGSANSFSSGGATAGSDGRSCEVTSSCEFCGYQALLSTVQEHWLSCPHKSDVNPTRQGVWMGR